MNCPLSFGGSLFPFLKFWKCKLSTKMYTTCSDLIQGELAHVTITQHQKQNINSTPEAPRIPSSHHDPQWKSLSGLLTSLSSLVFYISNYYVNKSYSIWSSGSRSYLWDPPILLYIAVILNVFKLQSNS